MPTSFSPQQEAVRKLLFTPCCSKEEAHDWVEFFLDLDLPDCIVDEDSNCTPLQMVWDCYSHQVHGSQDEDVSAILYYSCREGGKSLCESVIEIMLLFHARGNIFHLAAIREQSETVQEYIQKFLSSPILYPFMESKSKTSTGLYFYVPADGSLILCRKEWESLLPDEQQNYRAVNNNVEVIVATVQSCNGKHGMLVLDEIDVMLGDEKRAAYEQSKFIPSEGRTATGERRLPLTVLTSTRKTAFGIVQDEINKAAKTGLVIKHWNILDVTEACPPKRHLPDESKIAIYTSDESLNAISEEDWQKMPAIEQAKFERREDCYAGCLSKCKIFAMCKGRLANRQTGTSKFLKSITHVQNQVKKSNIDRVQCELMCWKPMTTGLVYPRFSNEKHIITPARAYEMIMGEPPSNPRLSKGELLEIVRSRNVNFYGGMDFGFAHSFAYVHAFRDVSKLFICNAFAMPELDPEQKLDAMEPFKKDMPVIWPDPEDPGSIKIFRNKGYRLLKWTKNKGSVVGGISIVQMKMTPPLGAEPELFIIRDIYDDPGIDLLIKHVGEHHWKLDAVGNPTNMISDDNKDLPDAMRYLVMHVFPYSGQVETVATPENSADVVPPVDSSGKVQYEINTWMAQRVAELTGQDFKPIPKKRKITIQSIGGRKLVFDNYYDEDDDSTKDKDLERGFKGGASRGIVWDFGG